MDLERKDIFFSEQWTLVSNRIYLDVEKRQNVSKGHAKTELMNMDLERKDIFFSEQWTLVSKRIYLDVEKRQNVLYV